MRVLGLMSIGLCLVLNGCVGNMNPTGSNSNPNYPYYTTQHLMTVKKIVVPAGTTLTYEKYRGKEGKQEHLLAEDKLTEIQLPKVQTIDWGGVPVTMIAKFFNSEMKGFSVYASFDQLAEHKKTRFSRQWQSCDDDLGITVKDTTDWSFNKANIADVESCSVLYQRYFKDNPQQQKFLDSLYTELMKIESK
ncbi:hypothetical protein [Acinetobacter sp. TR11]|uniref:hypothetical protein n=1 Tax=Acinetobacter sp. TR11 TaxID=3003393 RepID=UPI0022AC8A31|nr:hypothetical protein [Acinetobacter sp. TR11]WAU72253.1 hypothetical protein O1450_08880 [Acinetobacter sp. TR11]